jgi:hypothetical protein
LYLHLRSSLPAVFRRPIERPHPFVVIVIFVVQETPFGSVTPFLRVNP